MAENKLFNIIHSLGLLRPLLKISGDVRYKILESVHFNTDLITNQLAILDMLTDSKMHRISDFKRFLSKGAIDLSAVKLENVLKKITGFSNVFAVSQGRQAEKILTEVLAPSGKIVITNGLFITAYFHTINAGADIQELPINFTSLKNEVFQGNIDIVRLKNLIEIEKPGQISHVYIECCNNALGGKPVSFNNFHSISQLCRNNGIPVIIDATRIFQNAELIRRNEAQFKGMNLSAIVLKILNLAEGCTISSTKEMDVETGGIIGVNDPKLALTLGEKLMVNGEGLSVRAKAQLSRAYSSTSKIDKKIKKQVDAISFVYKKFQDAGIPVAGLPGGVGVYLNTSELQSLNISNPERAFLVSLYHKSGILGSVNYTTPLLNQQNKTMIRFVITPEMANYRTIRYFTRQLINVWKRKVNIQGLEKTWQPEGKSGEFFARYKIVD